MKEKATDNNNNNNNNILFTADIGIQRWLQILNK